MEGGTTRLASRAAVLCLVAVFTAGWPASALSPERAFHQYRLDVWQSEDGLPQGSVIAAVQTSDGYLWLGGYEGLARFDGVRFASFDRTNTPALGDNNVFALAESGDGSLWIGTDGGGLTRLKDARFTAHTTAQGLVDDRVLMLYPGRDGSLWIGTQGGLSRLVGGRFVNYTTRDGLPDNYVAALAEDGEGSLWIGTSSGLARLKDGSLSSYTTQDGLADNGITALATDRQGTLWIGTYRGALCRFRNGAFTIHARQGFAGNDAVVIFEDRDGNLWIGTYGSGLFRLRDGELKAYGVHDGLTSDIVWTLAEDHEGSLWIGTEGGGLLRLKDTPLTPVTMRDGLPHERPSVVLEGREGVLWIGFDGGGLGKLEEGSLTTYTTHDGLASDLVSAIHQRRDGTLWIGTEDGVNQLRDGQITADFAAEIGSLPIRAILEDRRARLWIGTPLALVCIEGRTVRTYTTVGDLPLTGVRALAEDRRGTLWIGTDDGLARFRDGEITAYRDAPGLEGAFVRAIHEDAAGTLWIGTRGSGLGRIRDGDLTTYTTRIGLFSDVIYQILEDGQGDLWMSCNKGIFRVSKKDLEDLARGRIDAVRSVSYGAADGMKSVECMGGTQPVGCKSRDGRLWFPTVKGLVAVDPGRLKPNPLAPPVYVEEVLSGGLPVAGDFEPGAPLVLPPGRGELEFRYTALSFLNPGRIRFKHFLIGYDKSWVDAGGRRFAFYTNLSPGSYRFRVIASNDDGVWNETGDAVEIVLRPAFYQTWTFYVACAAAAVLLARSLHRLRTRSLIRRNEELRLMQTLLEAKNAEVEAKSVEMQRFAYAVSHDLKSPLLTILGFLGFLEKDCEEGDKEKLAADLERLRHAATTMRQRLDELLELSRVGRLVNPPQRLNLGDLAREAVELVAGRIAARGVEVVVAPDLPTVTGDRPRLLQVFQNLIDNAVKFMGAQSAPRIEIGSVGQSDGRNGGEVICYVKDNGMGIAPRHHQTVFGLFDRLDAGVEGSGMGLALVKRIVEVHGGRIWVESEGEGQGSTFYFALRSQG